MITIFATPKPFRGHADVIQRNAIRSWTLLHPEAEVILFGDEEGAAEVARELGIRHESEVRRNEYGTKYLDYIFDRAHELSRHNVLCYANCDIMFTSDLREAIEAVSPGHSEFLMVGRRWDVDITEPWDFSDSRWEKHLRTLALTEGKRKTPSWVDYFVFSRDLYYRKMPRFLIGRWGWDPWLTWHARASGVPLIDATHDIVAVHQNHDYAYLGQGAAAARGHQEAAYNWALGHGTAWHFYTSECADRKLVRSRVRRNYLCWLGPLRSRFVSSATQVWFRLLDFTRPIRHRIGLRRAAE